MNLKQLFADEDAVSPVIGVILMVAITVILAAVIGTFVLGLGENVQDSAPQANFQFEYSGDFTDTAATPTVEVTHTGGEDVTASTLTVTVGGENVYDGSTGAAGSGDWTLSTNNWGSGDSSVSTGSNIIATNSDSNTEDGDDVRVIWTSPSGGTSNTIGSSTVPS